MGEMLRGEHCAKMMQRVSLLGGALISQEALQPYVLFDIHTIVYK